MGRPDCAPMSCVPSAGNQAPRRRRHEGPGHPRLAYLTATRAPPLRAGPPDPANCHQGPEPCHPVEEARYQSHQIRPAQNCELNNKAKTTTLASEFGGRSIVFSLISNFGSASNVSWRMSPTPEPRTKSLLAVVHASFSALTGQRRVSKASDQCRRPRSRQHRRVRRSSENSRSCCMGAAWGPREHSLLPRQR